MADRIHLSVVTADGVVFDKMVSYVNIPTDLGCVGIMANHSPLLCAVKKGKICCSFGENQKAVVEVDGGIASIIKNEANLLLSAAEVIEA